MRDAQEHFSTLRELLDLEAVAEKEAALRQIQRRSPAEAEAGGESLVNLVIREEETGLGGRLLLTLAKRNQTQSLPWSRLGVGTPIILSEEGLSPGVENSGWRGLVSRVNREGIQVALNAWPETENDRPTFRLDRSTDEISRDRQRQALDRALAAKSSTRSGQLREILLGQRPAFFRPVDPDLPLITALNPSQSEAVRFALGAQDLAVIHGPPGTGKSTTAVALIRELIQRGEKILACAPSNLAVDNLVERLAGAGEKVLRLGHPARVSPALREHTLDLLIQNHPDMAVVEKLNRDARTLRSQAGRFTRAKPERGARQAMRQEVKAILDDARRLERQVVERILDGASVICATLTGVDRAMLGERRFDCCVVDEAGQSTEPAAWIPLAFADRLILAGDPFQLPPTVVSPQATARGFNVSLLERVMTEVGPEIARRLTIQYRMHRAIMDFSSAEFYGGALSAHPSVAEHLLIDLPGVMETDLTAVPVHYIDTAGAGYDEILEPDGESRLNPEEAGVVGRKVQALLDAGLPATEIAVIAPYSAQVRLLREQLDGLGVEVDSVDGFQGREKEAVVLCLVRANPTGEIGFLSDVRRMNVALTRARRKLIVIGDSATVTAHPFYQRLVDYFEEIGAYSSVWEEM